MNVTTRVDEDLADLGEALSTIAARLDALPTDFSLLIYTDSKYGDIVHPAAELLHEKTERLWYVFTTSRPRLYRVVDVRNVTDAIWSLGAWGCVSLIGLPTKHAHRVLSAVRNHEYRVTCGPEWTSSLLDALDEGTSFFEISTDTDSESFLVACYTQDIPTMIRESLDSIGLPVNH